MLPLLIIVTEETHFHAARDDIHQLVHVQTSLDESSLDHCIQFSAATAISEDAVVA